MSSKPYIFVDLDETLIHTFNSDEDPIGEYKTFHLADGKYETVLRSGAHSFLGKLRELGDVFMLTIATQEYAQIMNAAFEFNFNTKFEIFSRENIKDNIVSLPQTGQKVYLFDNLHRSDNGTKIRYLRPLWTDYSNFNYIQVKEFSGEHFPFSEEYITELIKQVK